MAKGSIIRSRVNNVLKERLAQYIENENRRGRSIDESSVLRDAVVEFLDREEQRPELPARGAERFNELPPAAADPHLVTPGEKETLKKAVRKTEEQTASSSKDHLDDSYAREMKRRRAAKTDRSG